MFLLYSKNAPPGPNAASYNNPAYDRLYEQMAIMEPSSRRTEIIRQAEDIAFGDGVWSMMFYPLNYNISHGWLKNYRPNSLISGDIKYYDIDLELKKQLRPKL